MFFPGASGIAVCIYAISTTFSLLPRILYYVSFTALLLGHHYILIQQVALLSVMLFSTVSAIYVCILLGIQVSKQTSAVDLDMIALWPILATGAITVVPIIEWSKIVRSSKQITVIIFWGVMNWVGAVAILIGVTFLGPISSEPICKAANGTLLENPYQLMYQREIFNCSYASFERDNPMRAATDARLFVDFNSGYPASLAKFDFPLIWLSATVLVQPFHVLYTTWIVSRRTTSLQQWKKQYKEYRRSPRSSKILFHLILYCLILVISLHNFLLYFATIVVMELYIHQAGFEDRSAMANQDAWSGWVCAALVLAVCGVESLCDKKKERQKIKDVELQACIRPRRWSAPPTVDLSLGPMQSSGRSI